MQEVFKTAAADSSWILSETKFRAHFLRRELKSARGFIGTFGDGYFRLLQIFLPGGSPIARLSQSDEDVLLIRLIRGSGAFPRLAAELDQRPETSLRLLKRSVTPIRRFIETVRLHERNELLLKDLLDEFGNTKLGHERLAEVFVLLESYRNFQLENRTFDPVGVLEVLSEILSRGPAALQSSVPKLPPVLLLDQPTELFPLERRVLLALNQLLPTRIILDASLLSANAAAKPTRLRDFIEQLPPSKRSLGTVLYFASTELQSVVAVPPLQPETSAALGAIFDGVNAGPESKLGRVSIHPARERRDEVGHISRAIGFAVEQSRLKPGDVHIVALDLDSYGEQFERSLSSFGVPVWMPKGRRISETPLGSLLDALVQWTAAPSLQSLRALVLHPSFVSQTESGRQSYLSFVARFGSYPTISSLIQKSGEEDSQSAVKLGSFFAHAEYLGLPAGVLARNDWAKPFLDLYEKRLAKWPNPRPGELKKLFELIRVLGVVDAERNHMKAARALETLDEMVALVRRRFHAVRSPINKTIPKEFLRTHPAERRELGYSAAALRELRSLLAQAQLFTDLSITEAPGQDRISVFAKNISELLTSRFVALSAPENAVAITELLDVRAMQSRIRVLTGFTADAFPSGARQFQGTELDRASDELTRIGGAAGAVFEAYALFGHVLRNSEELHITFPRQGSSNETEPAPMLEQLSRWLDPQAANSAILSEAPLDWRPRANEDAELLAKGAALLEQRLSAGFTPFDGFLTGEVSADEVRQAVNVAGSSAESVGQTRFTVSDLETFSDCPHHYFFERALGLGTDLGSFQGLLSQETGTVVHSCLSEFFKQAENSALVRKHFDAACKVMLKIAKQAIGESILSSLEHPFARAQCDRLILGLDETGDDSKRGILKGALAFEVAVMLPRDVKCEVKFFGDKALKLESEAGTLAIVGAIDRIDFATGENGEQIVESIWDYKTGPAKTPRDVKTCRSLQVPLYALAVQQNFEQHVLPKRGGMIRLAEPNRRGDELMGTGGVLVDHLWAKSIKTDFAEQTEAIVQHSADHVRALGAQFADASFHQKLDTKACPHCDFRQVCYRDEALLEKKIRGEERILASDTPAEQRDATPFGTKKSSIGTLSGEQQAAVEISHNIALTAGAGSGKTSVMCARAIRLVLSGAPLSSIVAITFTEKAALEIRARIERIIDQCLEMSEFQGEPLSDEQRKLMLQARMDLPGAPIGTIHSLAANIVRMDPVLSGLGDFNGVIQGGEQADLIALAVDETFSDSGRSAVRKLLAQGVSHYALAGQIPALVRNRRERERLRDSLNNPQMRERILTALKKLYRNRVEVFLAKLRNDLGEWHAAATEWMGVQTILASEQALYYQALIGKVAGLCAEIDRASGDSSASWADSYEDLHDFAAEPGMKLPIKNKKTNPKNFWIDLRNMLRGKRRLEMETLRARFEREETGFELAREVVMLAEQVSSAYRRMKLSAGFVDFDDLIFKAHEMLCSDTTSEFRERQGIVRSRIRSLYRHLMVDEFQDTDILQWEMVRSIVDSIFQRTQLTSGEQTVFIVGDPQQAIYGFRGGDVRVFNRAKSEIAEASGRALTLQDNYRSHPAVIDFVNGFFEQLFAVDFDADQNPLVGTAVSAQRMLPKRGADETVPRVSALFYCRADADEDDDAAESLTEADRVADLITSALNPQNTHFTKLGAEDGPKIAVLTRKVKDLELVGRALETRGVPYSISHSSGFFERDEILQLENLCKYLLEPGDTIALIGALRSPLFGLSDAELLRLNIELGGAWEKLSTAAQGLTSTLSVKVFRRLRRWQKLAVVLKPSQLFESIVEDSGLGEVYRLAGESERFRNIERVVDVLRCAEKSQPQAGSLRFAADWFARQHFDSSNAPTANNALHPVLLTTVHASKGLEFPMVILPFLGSKTRSEFDFVHGELEVAAGEAVPVLGIKVEDDTGSFERKQTVMQMLIKESADKLTAAEERRLFYVACTRARDYLVLSLEAEKKFDDNQKAIAEMSDRERAEECFTAAVPWVWFRHLLQPDSIDDPTKWALKAGSGELGVPILR